MSNYKKKILRHPKFYITEFIKYQNDEALLFIHGGPGYNCGIIEHLIEHDNLFDSLNHNIILYDQRNCGRTTGFPDHVLHTDNIDDLEEIYQYLNKIRKIKITGIIGHSYGAKLLFDFCNKFNNETPCIFVSTAKSILVPRLNNLIFDMSYLKKTHPEKYSIILQEMDSMDLNKLWSLTEELAGFSHENTDRHYLYWANLECFNKYKHIQSETTIPVNSKTFMSVRKDLYSIYDNFSVDISRLDIPYLWINGFHDFIMNGTEGSFSTIEKLIIFYKSAHYPHIEENHRFSELINDFLSNV